MRLSALYAVLAALTLPMAVQAQSSSAKTVWPATSIATDQSSSSSVSSVAKSSTSTATGIPPAITHKVQVGLADHKFKPDTIRTAQGDVRLLFPLRPFV
jgi:hypothetical protein